MSDNKNYFSTRIVAYLRGVLSANCRRIYFALLASWILLLVFLPQLSLAVVILNLLMMLTMLGMQFYSALLPRKQLHHLALQTEPFVSIHIPTHNEPPELVMSTLMELKKLNYQHFEVIVLDNNTQEPELWKPVSKKCQELGPQFKFRHVENMKGYKAGALNICLSMSNPDTEYILVIDADYKVEPALLQEALGYFSDENVALVQFPQAYVNTSRHNQGLHGEYDHFFEVYMNMANHYNCVLSTGTVSVISKKALKEVGGWSSSTITEDCELGLCLHQNGYRGVYVPKPLGKGLMPTDLHALKVQRERWVFGNMQTLIKFLRLPKDKLSFNQCTGIFTQLTAWFNFLLIPVLGILSGAAGMLFTSYPSYHGLFLFSLLSIWVHLIGKFLFFRIAFRYRSHSLIHAVDTYLVHLGLAWEGALSWVRCLCGENICFKRTNKFLSLGKREDLVANLLFSLFIFLAGILVFSRGYYSEALLAWLATPAFVSVYFLRKLCSITYQLSQDLQMPRPV